MNEMANTNRPIGIDLFAGAGGMSLGFEQAGFDVRAAVEIDPIHCATHKFNFPKCAILPRSVEGLTASAIRTAAGLTNEKIDVVFGGPPCQGFSLIGQRSLDDKRNNLVLEFVRLVAELGAQNFVFENVKGLTVGRQKQFLEEIISAFNAAGYNVASPWRVLNAAAFGVPQNRERLILLGSKKGTKLPIYPHEKTRHRRSYPDNTAELVDGPKCSDALNDLPDAEKFPDLLKTDCVQIRKIGVLSNYAAEMRALSNDAWHYGYIRNWNPSILTSSARTDHTEISRRRFAETQPGNVEPISRFFKLASDGISNTLRAGTDSARGAFTSPRPIHYKYNRCVTVREMARLHGYPDWFRFHATKWHGARQIGNSVPPPLARALAEEIIIALGMRPTHPTEIQSLGSADLLSMEMSKAAAHFGVIRPSGRRDKKSGAKKRKQHEIETERFRLLEVATNA